MATIAQRIDIIESDLSGDARCELEADLGRRVAALLGPEVCGLDVVDAVAYHLLSRLTPEDVVRIAEDTDAIEAIHRAGQELRLEADNVVPFRRRA